MNLLKKRKLKRAVRNFNFKAYKEQYGETEEYQAMEWWKSYIEHRASAEPEELLRSVIIKDTYAWTIAKYL